MLCEFLTKSDSKKLIVIFAGWSTDASFYSHITLPGWDTLIVSGYSDLDFPVECLSGYTTVALFAWSLGVYAASQCFPFEKASISVAINGTEHPVDDSLGIPENIFTGTANSLNERNLTKFRRRMSGKLYARIADKFPSLPIEDLKSQLFFINGHYRHFASDERSYWNRVYISKEDMIFPPSTQRKAWEIHNSHPQIIEVDAPHYIDLLHIIKAALPRHEAVGKRFEKAMPTYSEAASPQKTISSHLIQLLKEYAKSSSRNNITNKNNESNLSFDKVLEIGPGTGFLTRRFAEHFHPKSIDFVELFKTDKFNAAPVENYFEANAESWIADAANDAPQAYDAIISASAMQWFVNPREFFCNAAAVLKPGGILLCSTFLPGNLEELTAVNPYGLVYHSTEHLRNLLPEDLKVMTMEEDSLTITFASPRELLAHLIKTGVGGSSKSTLPVSDLLRKLPTALTYRPLYILAQKLHN